ncbi:hypothetical protein B0A55_05526 [Friedmanniomyces simplex]|uniref:Uncharacterized protein n=1 Tax=Friedmanniomyces simplex TaxID=329884 RepID=A0A4U0XAU5_9PEZI|nr:hypothetical protein B0A55_05526 [Friedmanniomyces simplex]
MATCNHHPLHYDVSANAGAAGYKRPSMQQRLAATRPSGRSLRVAKVKSAGPATDEVPADSTFPAPLVLPGDELSFDPRYPPQSLRSWKQLKERNVVTDRRRTIYVGAPPKVAQDVQFVDHWAVPEAVAGAIKAPAFEDIVNYLQAFYHGLPVRVLHARKLCFVDWDDGVRKKLSSESDWARKPRDVALATRSEAIRIRVRKHESFPTQLNLNDLLDVAISILPDDAYALLMIVNHDLYEDEDDDFCCKVSKTATSAALAAHLAHPSPTPGTTQSRRHLELLWLSRVCKTASHELGHCFGIDHCTYYACVMQGTAGLSEDARQPPYVCPVDTAKLLTATGADEMDWLRALLNFCERFGEDALFAAFAAWLRMRLAELGMGYMEE